MSDEIEGEGSGVEVRMPMQAARDGRFPPVCAMTGTPADGAIPLKLDRSATKWKAHTVRIPLSEAIFKKWSRRRSVHIKGRVVAAVLASIAIVICFRNAGLGLSILAVAGLVHVADLWGERTSAALEPTLARERDELVLHGVHPDFAAAMERTDR
jgi:hypothetical protein